jgi:hypothetical protein
MEEEHKDGEKKIRPSCATSCELTEEHFAEHPSKNVNIVSVTQSKVENIGESQTKCG